jgi:dolichol-phosphate mannosyltransferase
MSGFFMIRSEVLRAVVPNLSAVGFKILLDIFMSAPKPPRYVELPHCFRSRSSGSSKMDAKVLLDFAELLIDKFVGRIVPAKFVLFSLVGSFGVGVHLVTLAALFAGLGFGFATSQIVATLMAMTSNFALNNVLTYHDRRLRGWNWLKGWFSFAFACSIGAIANVGVATYLFGADLTPWLVSGLAGIMVGVVWNYAVTSLVTWKRE